MLFYVFQTVYFVRFSIFLNSQHFYVVSKFQILCSSKFFNSYNSYAKFLFQNFQILSTFWVLLRILQNLEIFYFLIFLKFFEFLKFANIKIDFQIFQTVFFRFFGFSWILYIFFKSSNSNSNFFNSEILEKISCFKIIRFI